MAPATTARSSSPPTVGNFTSACCASRLARGNASERTHSDTSSNYLCTNGARGRPHSEERRDARLTSKDGVDAKDAKEAKAVRAEGLDPDDPAVVAALDLRQVAVPAPR